ncbi:hypothetical protein [Dyadobacter bucti]|uniref:hypothetical protein n=1 Tax=Dyadobacter bucti TaxID=2572203 RepID=UPI00110824CB|nr:hypothetical protein [Dyadobacter bucti]
MRKRSITLLTYGLALMFLMYNCKKKDTDPLKPDEGLVDEINKIEVETVTLTPPAPVVATEGKFEASAEAAAVSNALEELSTSGVVPESLKAAGAGVSASLTPEEIATMSTITPDVLAVVEGGGALPANLKAVLDKVAADPSLSVYLPKVTYPTVAGVEIKAQRTAGVEAVEGVEGVLVNDACLAEAEAAFQVVKTKLDASRDTQLAAVATQYAADIALLAPAEAACNTTATTNATALRTAAKAVHTEASASLEAGKAVLGDQLYTLLKALTDISYVGYLSSVNTLEASEKLACTAKTTAGTTNAQAARDANTTAVQAAYSAALAEATVKKGELAESCHNQGGGQ